ncbi:hypothetical protein ACFSGX_15550 [Sphingomonas arantia]|uniref:Uncharacterized protein n=1 Tax=Sphingomonas arantia TaxID=1460676 RepID=A0ABW4U3P1_9SPHN
MTRRDMLWRGAGLVLAAAACTGAVLLDDSPLVIPLFVVALIGLTLIINGKRAATALHAERRGHGHTAEAIHAERVRRHRPDRSRS